MLGTVTNWTVGSLDFPLSALCADKFEEHVKQLRLDESGIRVAAYLTDRPPRKLLESKRHDAIQIARQQLSFGE